MELTSVNIFYNARATVLALGKGLVLEVNFVMTKEYLNDEYIGSKKPMRQIAEDAGCSITTVYRYIRKFRIKTRTIPEATKGRNNSNFGGMTVEKRQELKLARKNNLCNFKGHRKSNWAGYILIFKPEHIYSDIDGYVREHHLILEEQIKRSVKPKEVGYHINKIIDDNRIENLMLFITRAAHKRFMRNGIMQANEIIFDGSKQ